MYKLIIFFALICSAFAKHEEYFGQTLYDVKVSNVQQGLYLEELVERYFLDRWHPSSLVLVPQDMKEDFQRDLLAANIPYEVKTENFKEQLDLEDQLLSAASSRSSNTSRSGISFDKIHRYDVVNKYLDTLASSYKNVEVLTAGKTVEGRDIRYLRISSDNFQSRTKPVIFVSSLLHAREWVTLPATLYAIKKLVIDVTDRNLVDNIDWIIMPIANPDGYEYTHTNTRMWRKNRAPSTGLWSCPGVDLNRNFDVNWGTASSSSPCTETYHGKAPFSEPETQAIRNILNDVRYRLGLFIDLHSFGSMILYAYGSGELPSNALILNLVGVRMAEKIDAVKWPQNRSYRVGNIVHLLFYRASGGSSDWVQKFGNTLSYTYEMPAYRNSADLNGFLVDPAFIEQAGKETWEGISAGARYVLEQRRNAMA